MDVRVEVCTEEAQGAVDLGREAGRDRRVKGQMSGGPLPVRAWSRRPRGRDLIGQQSVSPDPALASPGTSQTLIPGSTPESLISSGLVCGLGIGIFFIAAPSHPHPTPQ